MNQAMLDALKALAPNHKRDLLTFDIFGFMNQVFEDPSAFGLADVTTACAYSTACIANPTRWLFWDGLHPTTAGHALLASAALASVNPEPEIYLLFGIGLAAIAWHRRLNNSR
jgi:outer membrane lipase/esterase